MIVTVPVTVTDSILTASNVAETDYAAWAAGTSYLLGQRVIVVGSNSHKVYESLQGTVPSPNLGHAPGGTTNVWWLEIGETNKWRMFNGTVQTQTSNTNTINITLVTTQRIDTIALLNIAAYTAQITVTDAIDGMVYNKTTVLASYSGINNWYSYFYEPVARKADFIAHDLPPYSSATINIILTDTGNTVAVGALIMGLQNFLGNTQYGAKVGIQDYSVKTQDSFGNYTVLQRSFRKTGSFVMQLPYNFVDQLITKLTALRSTPVLWSGSDSYNSTIIYGFYKDLSVTITYMEVSTCTLEIEGLT